MPKGIIFMYIILYDVIQYVPIALVHFYLCSSCKEGKILVHANILAVVLGKSCIDHTREVCSKAMDVIRGGPIKQVLCSVLD